MPTRVGDALAEGVLGARPGEVIVSDSTTVNLFKLCSAALDAYRLSAQGAVVTDRDNFPTDRYVLEGLAAQRGLELRMIDAEDARVGARARADGDGVALVVLSHVNYRTGALADMAELTDVARRYDAHVVWDLCALGRRAARRPARRRRRAGRRLHLQVPQRRARARPPSCTWRRRSSRACARRSRAGSASASSSRWTAPTTRCDGIGRFLAGTPPIAELAAVEEGVRLTAEAGIGPLRAKSVASVRADRRAARRVAGAARVRARLAARRGAPRLARLAAPPGGVADLPRADRARRRDPRLPRAGHDPARRRAALHALRRRLGRARPPARTGRARRAAAGGRRRALASPSGRSAPWRARAARAARCAAAARGRRGRRPSREPSG